MSKEQYEEMVMKHLNTDTYEQVANKNIDKKVMDKIEDFTNDYSDILEPEETKYLTDFKYSTSNYYVLPKVHKGKEITRFLETSPVDYLKVKDPLEIPSRPIVAGPNPPTHRLSTFLDIILRPLTEIVKSYVRDDLDFLHHLPKNIDFDSIFISLDVTSLYTNITHDRGIEAISYWIDQYPSHLVEERFTKEFIVAGLTLVLKNNYFKFSGKMWHQLVGTTMGSNVSVIFAILFMAYLEIHIYQNVRQMYPQDYAEYLIKAWKRFIDDCFLIWNKKFDFTPFFYMVNNLDPSITFTKEEDNKALPFLDIMVIKNHDNTIATDIFYKPTNSHRYLDFRSCHRHHTKVNVPFNLAQRICKIVSEEQRRDFRLEELKTFLISCYYPQELINRAINTAKDQNNYFTLNLQNSDIIPLVITNDPNHTIDFNHIKNPMNNVKCPRLKRTFKNKPLLSTRQPPNLKRLLTRAEYNPEEEQGVILCARPKCDLCRLGYLKIQTEVKSPTGATLFKLYKRFHCNSRTFYTYLHVQSAINNM